MVPVVFENGHSNVIRPWSVWAVVWRVGHVYCLQLVHSSATWLVRPRWRTLDESKKHDTFHAGAVNGMSLPTFGSLFCCFSWCFSFSSLRSARKYGCDVMLDEACQCRCSSSRAVKQWHVFFGWTGGSDAGLQSARWQRPAAANPLRSRERNQPSATNRKTAPSKQGATSSNSASNSRVKRKIERKKPVPKPMPVPPPTSCVREGMAYVAGAGFNNRLAPVQHV